MKKFIVGSMLLASLFTNFVYAEDVKDSKEIISNIEKNNPDFKGIQELRTTSVPGIYEVKIHDSDIFYSDKEGKNFFFGALVQNQQGVKVNLTEKRVQSLVEFDFKNINKADAMVRKIGSGKNVLITFEDPNCSYCKKLHDEIVQLKDVTIYTYIVPILGEQSVEVSKSIWCSTNKAKAWDDYMENRKINTINQSCDSTALQRNVELSNKHKVRGTPAIFFANGKTSNGYMSAKDIMSALSKK